MHKTYKSKLGTLYILVLCFMLIPLFSMLYEGVWAGVFITAAVIAFLIYIYFATSYIIDGDKLIIKIGFLGTRVIPVISITSIESTGSLLSAPAFSINGRLQVNAMGNSVVISPKRPGAFCTDLQEINPDIVVPLSIDRSCCE